MKKSVLLIGEHPYSTSGNGHMMAQVLEDIPDSNNYDVTVFCISDMKSEMSRQAVGDTWYTLFPAMLLPSRDEWGPSNLLYLIENSSFDIVAFIGIDVWRYVSIYERLLSLQKSKKFTTIGLFPYDVDELREDWLSWFEVFDLPYTYSEHLIDDIRKQHPRIQYFRPSIYKGDIYTPYTPEQRLAVRQRTFAGQLQPDNFVFGFVGNNQIRKDPIRLIKAFACMNRNFPKTRLFMHTNSAEDAFNLQSLVEDCNIPQGVVFVSVKPVTDEQMVDIYNSIDCLINCTVQEGLGWAPLNAALCRVPLILSDTTEQAQIFASEAQFVEPTETVFIPTMTKYGASQILAKACSPMSIYKAMERIYTEDDTREENAEGCHILATAYQHTGMSFTRVLDKACTLRESKKQVLAAPKEKAILFIQHSGAGDVLMSSQCFKGLKARHKGRPLHYMTQQQFKTLVEGNPYIDKVLDWNNELPSRYEIVYNPHGERILPGGFNSLDVTLHSMYPYFCRVEADDIFVPLKPPLSSPPGVLEGFGPDKIVCVVHTTGGQPQYRTYKHLDIALQGLDFYIIQIGAKTDFKVQSANLDLRGVLDWPETAWVLNAADVIVAVDSCPMHMAGALGKNIVALFGPAPARVTQPRMQGGKLITLEPNKLDVCPSLTNCWGQPGNPCQSPCINTINPYDVRNAVILLLNEGGQQW